MRGLGRGDRWDEVWDSRDNDRKSEMGRNGCHGISLMPEELMIGALTGGRG